MNGVHNIILYSKFKSVVIVDNSCNPEHEEYDQVGSVEYDENEGNSLLQFGSFLYLLVIYIRSK